MNLYWSKYNFLFELEDSGYFLYNSLSNTFLQINERIYSSLCDFNGRGQMLSEELSFDVSFLDLMLMHKNVFREKNDEETELLKRHYKRNKLCFENTHLDLSICPTLSCNFRCPYCFEKTQSDDMIMSSQTIEKILLFIEKQSNLKSISLTWYGGEPTIDSAFDVVVDITNKLRGVNIDFKEAALVTNGYLLDKRKIALLNDLNIKNIQVTIDGPQEVHDKRRIHASGLSTFNNIISNLDFLMNSEYSGNCNIRVNLDQNNFYSFYAIKAELLKRFNGENISVYAGYIDSSAIDQCDRTCDLCSEEWKIFTIEQFMNINDLEREGVYPLGSLYNICTANSINGYVIGPVGELYKCWEDVGNHNMVVGDISDSEIIKNYELISRYAIGTDPFNDAECQECKVLPICGGGCANRRLRKKYMAEKDIDYCSLYKNNLIDYLSAYYDLFVTKEMCAEFIDEKIDENMEKGYRIIHN